MSGVPDGRGGVLPPIKRQFPSSRLSPTTEENRMLGFATTPLDNAPPPLVAQRPSQVSPMRQSSGSFSFGYTPSRPLRQVSFKSLSNRLANWCFTEFASQYWHAVQTKHPRSRQRGNWEDTQSNWGTGEKRKGRWRKWECWIRQRKLMLT